MFEAAKTFLKNITSIFKNVTDYLYIKHAEDCYEVVRLQVKYFSCDTFTLDSEVSCAYWSCRGAVFIVIGILLFALVLLL